MQKVKLGDIAQIAAGQGAPQGDDKFGNMGLPFVRAGNLSDLINGKKEAELPKIDSSVAKKFKMKPYPKGSILFAKSGMSCMKGYVYVLKDFCYVVSHLAVVIPKSYNSNYLKYFLNFYSPNSLIKDAAYPSISLSDISEIEVPSISFLEQKAIAEKLDKVCSLIEKRKQQLSLLDTLVKSKFVEIFGDPQKNEKGWIQSSLKDVAIGKLSYGSGASAVDFDGETRYIRITDIMENGELTNEKKSPSNVDEKYLLKDGDILFARSGATVGKSFCYSSSVGRSIYAGYLIKLVPDRKKVIPEYIFNYTKTEYYATFVRNIQRAVAQPNINAQEYGDLVICVPPIALQNQFADFVKQTEKSKAKIKQSLVALELLKKSLMQKYFG